MGVMQVRRALVDAKPLVVLTVLGQAVIHAHEYRLTVLGIDAQYADGI